MQEVLLMKMGIRCTFSFLLVFGAVFGNCSSLFSPNGVFAADSEPRSADILKEAVSVWHFVDLNDSAGANSILKMHGIVELNVELSDSERSASLERGGDGKTARFGGKGFLSAGQGANGELNLSGRELTFYVRAKLGEIPVSFPIFSKHGGHANMAYNLFAFEDYVGVEIGTTGNKVNRKSETAVPMSSQARFSEMRGPETAPHRWLDLICRVDGAKMEFFVDGRCVDEDFMLGDLKQNDVPLLIGAQDTGNGPSGRFLGEIDTAAVWDRALSNEEILALSGGPKAVDPRERTDRGNGENLQYWCPPNAYGVGDCMPFSKDGVFHFVYLLDKKRHGAKNGWGAHQWIQATSTDLVNWTHQPFLVPITDQNEGSICTGSLFFFRGIYYALYANRSLDEGGKLAYAVSSDGIHFVKQEEPFVSLPEGYSGSLRDPAAFYSEEDGLVHLYATTTYRGRGCWAHIVTQDMKNWELRDPLYFRTNKEPECPDWFQWGRYFYSIAGLEDGIYRIAESPAGPWRLPSGNERIGQGILRVPKTAPWKDGRRIVTAFTEQRGYGGDAVFHELVQLEDGVLGEKFVPEMIPASGEAFVREKSLKFREKHWRALPAHYRMQAKVKFDPKRINTLLDFTFQLDPDGENAGETEIRLIPTENAVKVGNVRLENIDLSSGEVCLDVILIRDILDVCVQNCRTATVCVPQREERHLSVRDDSEFLTDEVLLLRDRKLPQSALSVETGYVLETLEIAPLKDVQPR